MLYKKTEKLSIIKREGEIMGMFVNPNAAAFQCAVNSEVYIDKTGLLEYTNKVLGTNARFICNSRPRRFGKSVTVDMLTAYYSKGCDTEKMFSGLEISKCPDFYEHLNKYDVIHFDVQWCCIRQFFSITLPLITPTLFFVLVTTLISTFQTFDTIYMMIQKTGLAMESSQSMVVYFYKNAFEFSKKGYASALAVFLFLIIMLITALQMKLQKKWVNYE